MMHSIDKFCGFFAYEWLCQWKNKASYVQSLSFFIVIVLLFPLTEIVDKTALQQFAPGIIWFAALFASLLTMDNLFSADAQSGFIDKCLTVKHAIVPYIGSKILVHWLLAGCPLVFVSPLIGLFFDLSFASILSLSLGLLVGSLFLSLLGTLLAVLTLPVQQKGLLIPLLIAPLMIPVLIFATSANHFVSMDILPIAPFCFLVAMLLVALVIAPLASVGILKQGEAG